MLPLQCRDHARFANNKGCVDDVMQGLPSPNPPSPLSFLWRFFCNPPHLILPRQEQFPRSWLLVLHGFAQISRVHTPPGVTRAPLVRVSPNFLFALLQQSTRHTLFSPLSLLNCLHARSFLPCLIFLDTDPLYDLPFARLCLVIYQVKK